ncbi:UNVERIFIED_ORG: hypothetical protein BDK47_1315 [Anoxybacillus amylolyticus]
MPASAPLYFHLSMTNVRHFDLNRRMANVKARFDQINRPLQNRLSIASFLNEQMAA